MKRQLDTAVIRQTVLARHPGLADACVRYDNDDAVYFTASRAGRFFCVAVHRHMVVAWLTSAVAARISEEIRPC